MKKILLSAAALLAFGIAGAQETGTTGFSEGDAFISGSVGYSSSKNGDSKNSNFNISPMAAYFVTNNIAVGGMIGYTSGKSEFDGEELSSTNGFSISALGRYYFTPSGSFSVFAQLQAGYLSREVETIDPFTPDYKEDGFGVGFGPGFSYFVSDHFAIEAGLGLLSYSSTEPDFDGAESTNNFEIGLNFSNVNFGVVYKF